MKHVSAMSKNIPSDANAIQDIICTLAQGLADFIENLGGFSPAVAWLEAKCDLPDPNP